MRQIFALLLDYRRINLKDPRQISLLILTNLGVLIYFYSPWNQQKTFGFLIISGGGGGGGGIEVN